MKKISVVIVDDHKLIREMWSKMIKGHKEISIVGESGSLEDAITLISGKKPDIVLLDINLSTGSGFDAVPVIMEVSPATKIIAVSMHHQPTYAKKMLKLGASGYVTKNSSHIEIFKAIDEVMKGKIYLCQEVKNILAEQKLCVDVPGPQIKDLSAREIEIIKYVKSGLPSKLIAAELGIAIKTVEAHRYKILKKLQLTNTAALLNFINTTELAFI